MKKDKLEDATFEPVLVPQKLDCNKITTLEEVKLILDCVGFTIDETAKNYNDLKHLIKD